MGVRIVEADLGFKGHDMKPLHALTDMAYQVAEAILKRAIRDGKIDEIRAREYISTIGKMDLGGAGFV